MRPVHGIVPFTPLDETIAPDLTGFLGHGPVRVGNQAANQMQNDVYGSVVLAAAQMFVDERLPQMGDESLFRLLEGLGEQALARAFEPDAGLWEYRTRARPHTYSATLCWAACDRLAGIARRLGIADRANYWETNARALRERILAEAWDEQRGALTGAFGATRSRRERAARRRTGSSAGGRPAVRRTCARSAGKLTRNGRIMRYDGAGRLRRAGDRVSRLQLLVHGRARPDRPRRRGARRFSKRFSPAETLMDLLSEDIHPDTGELWGNLPQTYSMAGIINTATRLSSSWEEAWARD